MEQKITVTPNKDGELIIRTGEAIRIKYPDRNEFTGVLSAPADYFEKRENLLNDNKTQVEFSVLDKRINFYENCLDSDAAVIIGVLEAFPDLTRIGINNQNQTHDVKGLVKLIRSIRIWFKDTATFDDVLKGLTSYNATIITKVDQTNKFDGNKKTLEDITVEHSLKLKFMLEMPLFNGTKKKPFEVEILCEPNGNSLKFWLESQTLQEMIKEDTEQLIADELARFGDTLKLQLD